MTVVHRIDAEGSSLESWPLPPGRHVLGRGKSCALRLDDRGVSREHAALEVFPDGRVVFIDLGSANGSFVNELPVRRLFLAEADTIRLGDTWLRFTEGDEEPSGATPSGAVASPASPPPSSPARWTSEPVPPETVLLDAMHPETIPPEWKHLYAKVRCLIEMIERGPELESPAEFFARVAPSVLLAGAATRAAFWWIPSKEDRNWRLEGEALRPGAPKTGWPAHPLDALRTVASRPGPSRLRASVAAVALEPASGAGRRPRARGGRATLKPPGGVRALAIPFSGTAKDAIASAPPLPPVALLYFETAPGGAGLSAADEEFLLSVGRAMGSLLLRAHQVDRLVRRERAMGREIDKHLTFVGRSPRIRELLEQVDRLAGTDTTVLVQGESGTGKELIARAIHHSSARQQGPLVCVNCSALPENLVESELFGHEKGAFTGAVAQRRGQFELAHGGTLFLDEIGDMPLAAQAKLLRVLETGEVQRVGGERTLAVDVRVVAATHRDLIHEAREGRFREDLYYRLGVVALRLPPLRERPEDIDDLATYFLKTLRRKIHSPLRQFRPDAMRLLRTHEWPGNVRQLRNVIERALVFASGETGGVELLPQEVLAPRTETRDLPALAPEEAAMPLASPPDPTPPTAPPRTLAEVEKAHILSVVVQCNGNRSLAAQTLGISRSTLYEKTKDESPKKTTKGRKKKS